MNAIRLSTMQKFVFEIHLMLLVYFSRGMNLGKACITISQCNTNKLSRENGEEIPVQRRARGEGERGGEFVRGRARCESRERERGCRPFFLHV
jgi:hypothetical protein